MIYKKINFFFICISACLAILFGACKKNEEPGNSGLFFKSIETDSGTVAICALDLHDGSYLIISRDKQQEHAGYAFKIDREGNLIFKKRLFPLNYYPQTVIDLPGNGFAAVGKDDYNLHHINACLYDDDANFISSKQIQLPQGSGNYPIFRILHLSNGNYALASGNGADGTGILLFTDNDFNNINNVTFSPPPGFTGYAINALCEMPGNTIAISGSTSKEGATALLSSYTNLFVFRTDFSGNQKSFVMVNDTLYSETPNCLLNISGNLFSVTGRSIGWNSGNGSFVDYEFSRFNSTISGMINLNVHDSLGNLLTRKQVTGYPLNGMIQAIKPTTDGGYILCGTVNQGNTATLVSETKLFLLKIDADRSVTWNKIINTTYPSYGTDVFQTADGGYFITGQENTFGKKIQTIVIRTDATGNIL